MVRLFRGGNRRGRGVPRPPLSMMRHMRPHEFAHEFIPPYVSTRGRLLRGHPGRPGLPRPPLPPPPPPPTRMGPPPLPPLPHRRLPLPPPHVREMPRPMPMHLSRRPVPPPLHPMAPPMHPMHGPPIRRQMRMRPGPRLVRGRGGLLRRGAAVKRLGSSANGRVKKVQKRKEKTEGEFYCETCDRSWKTAEKLEEHLAEHQVCGRDGCKFTAHPKLLLKHIEVQHDSGLYQRIVFTQKPEDIAKWIAERKRHYPTKQNVEIKEAQAKEMVNRGERIPSRGRPFQNRGRFGNSRDRKGQRGRNNKCTESVVPSRTDKPLARKSRINCEVNKWRDPDAWRGDLPKFLGTAAFSNLEDTVVEDTAEEKQISDEDECTDVNTDNKTISKPFVSNVLALLMVNYGTDMTDDDDDDDDDDNTIPSKTQASVTIMKTEPVTKLKGNSSTITNNDAKEEIIRQPDNKPDDLDSGPEECAIVREDKSNIPIVNSAKENKTQSIKATKPNVIRPNTRPKRPPMRKYQLSLLEKLLQNEIRNERNIILQCVRFVVKNNFFGCGNSAINKTG